MPSTPSWSAAEDLRAEVLRTAERDGGAAAAELIGRHWDRYATTEPQHLLNAVRALPGEVFVDNPGMVVAANYLQHVAVDGAPHRFEQDQHLAGISAHGGSLPEQLIGLTGTTATERTRGEHDRAVAAARAARSRVDAAPDPDVAAMRPNLPHLFLQWGRSLEAAGDGAAAAYEYEEAHRLASVTDQAQIARRAAAHLAWFEADRGRLRSAERWLDRARRTGEPNPRYDAVLHLADALLELDRGDRHASGAALARMSVLPLGEYWAAAAWVRSWHAVDPASRSLLGGEIAEGTGRHAEAVSTGGANRWYLRGALSRLALPHDRHPGDAPADVLLDAVAAYRTGAAGRAAELAHDVLAAPSTLRVRAYALVVAAAAALGDGRAAAARHDFAQADEVIRSEGLRTAYSVIAPSHREQLAGSRDTTAHSTASPDDAEVPARLAALTAREREVLHLLASERSTRDIATELFISPNTLKATLRRAYRKLGVHSRREAVDTVQVAARAR